MILSPDTSTLVKLYHDEEGAKEIDEFIQIHKVDRFYISGITRLKFASAVCRKVRMK